MTMKTFAFVEQKPIVAVTSLEAMAAEYCGLPEVVVTPVLPCRSGVVYACPYTVAVELPVACLEPTAFTFAELGEAVKCAGDSTLLFCGPAARRYEPELRASLGDRAGSAVFGTVDFPRAAALGRLAVLRLEAGAEQISPLEVVPLYISPPPITLPKQPIRT